MREFRRRHSLAIVFHDHAARQEVLSDEKFFNRAGKVCFDGFAVGDNHIRESLAVSGFDDVIEKLFYRAISAKVSRGRDSASEQFFHFRILNAMMLHANSLANHVA
jgi:hypothetical protein